MDTVQFILLVVIIILTVLLVILGTQVFFILRDVRRTLRKTNRFLDNANLLTDTVHGPLANVNTIVTGLRSGSVVTLLKIARSLLSHDRHSSEHHHKE